MTACPAVGIATASDTRVAAHVSPLGSDTTASHRSRFAARWDDKAERVVFERQEPPAKPAEPEKPDAANAAETPPSDASKPARKKKSAGGES